MKILLIVFSIISTGCFAQSFEGKLTYLSTNSTSIDTHYVYIRGDSVRIELSPRLNASTYLYFAGKKSYSYYSKRDQTYFSHPFGSSDSPHKVLANELKYKNDSITLLYQDKLLNLTYNVETITTERLNLHPKLRFFYPINAHIEPLVLNGSGYIAEYVQIERQFDSALGLDTRKSSRKLIDIDYRKPAISLFMSN